MKVQDGIRVTCENNYRGWHIWINGAYSHWMDMKLEDVIRYYDDATHMLNRVDPDELASARKLDITALRPTMADWDRRERFR